MGNALHHHLVGRLNDSGVVAIVLPGARCRAGQYQWLAKVFLPLGIAVCFIDPPERHRPALSTTLPATHGQFVTVEDVVDTIDWILTQAAAVRFVLIGHSLGGVVLLEQLDHAEAQRSPLYENSNSRGPIPWNQVIAVATLGSALERTVGPLEFPWRSCGTRLYRPAYVDLVMFAGQQDTLVPLAAVAQTASRFMPPATVFEIVDAGHFDWTSEHNDTRIADEPSTNANRSQSITGRELLEWLRPRLRQQLESHA